MGVVFVIAFLICTRLVIGQDPAFDRLKNAGQNQLLWISILIAVLIGFILAATYFLHKSKARKIARALNYEIDKLTSHNRELLERYKSCLASENVKGIESTDHGVLKKAIDIIEKNISDLDFLKTLNRMR